MKEIEAYFSARCKREGWITYSDKINGIAVIRDEILNGMCIMTDTTFRLPSDAPVVMALRDGRPISVAGGERDTVVTTSTTTDKKRGFLGIGLLLLLLIMGLMMVFLPKKPSQAEPTQTETTSVAAQVGDEGTTPTDFPTPTNTPTPRPTATPAPTPSPLPTRNEEGLPIEEGETNFELRPDNAPISLEIGGVIYEVGIADIAKEISWQPRGGAEWLLGTTLRMVFAVPYDEKVLNQLVFDSTTMRVRTLSAQTRDFRLTHVSRVRCQEVETMSVAEPSILVVFYDEQNNSSDCRRYVAIGDAVQISDSPMEMERVVWINSNTLTNTVALLGCVRNNASINDVVCTLKTDLPSESFSIRDRDDQPVALTAQSDGQIVSLKGVVNRQSSLLLIQWEDADHTYILPSEIVLKELP